METDAKVTVLRWSPAGSAAEVVLQQLIRVLSALQDTTKTTWQILPHECLNAETAKK